MVEVEFPDPFRNVAGVENYLIRCFWGNRKESPEHTATQIQQYLAAIRSVDPMFASWYEPPQMPGESPEFSQASSIEDLVRLVEKGGNKDDDGVPWPELGFCADAWNAGVGGGSISIGFHCGLHDSPGMHNSVIIMPPLKGEAADRLLSVSILRKFLGITCRHWQPDIGQVTSNNLGDIVEKLEDADPNRVGWLTALPVRVKDLPELPATAKVEEIQEYGSLILATEERFSSSRPDHVESAVAIERALRQFRGKPL